MSKMLEQAILDAEQLKEAAIKNAESALLEKYSDQIRSAVDSILEQDEMMGADLPANDLPVGLPTEEDATCGCPDKVEDMEIPIDTLLGEPVADEVEVDFRRLAGELDGRQNPTVEVRTDMLLQHPLRFPPLTVEDGVVCPLFFIDATSDTTLLRLSWAQDGSEYFKRFQPLAGSGHHAQGR